MPQDSSSPAPEVHPPTLEEVLDGLRLVNKGGPPRKKARAVLAAIAFLESLPEEVKRSEMEGDAQVRCTECGWVGAYRVLEAGLCPVGACHGEVEPL